MSKEKHVTIVEPATTQLADLKKHEKRSERAIVSRLIENEHRELKKGKK